MILGILADSRDYMQAPTAMTQELFEFTRHPAFRNMMQYAFIGSKETVGRLTVEFLKQTGVDEVIVASHIYHQQDRINSYRTFSEVMKESKASAGL